MAKESPSQNLEKSVTPQPLALSLMEKNRSVKERSLAYFQSIQRNIQRDVIDAIIAKKEAYEEKLYDLSNFTLDTNLNAGLRQMTREECEKRFKEIIEIEYQLKLTELELEAKQRSFNKYFSA